MKIRLLRASPSTTGRIRQSRTRARGVFSRRATFELLEQRMLLAGDTYLINFQNDEASVPTRYLRDLGETFGVRPSGLSYGWSADHTDQARERSLAADQRLDTLIHIEAGANWEIALPNGLYSVEVAVGDPANNEGVHTINVESINLLNGVADGNGAITASTQVTVADGRLTVDSGGAANMATRINYIHIVNLSAGGNAAPAAPIITEPSVNSQIVSPADVHMEAIGYADGDGDLHKSTDWEIWTVGPGAQPVWQTLGIEGVERLHTHLGDGIFLNAQAGETQLAGLTDYELRVRFRDDAGSVSGYAVRPFRTAATSTVFPLEIEGVSPNPAPTWITVGGSNVDLPASSALLAPGDFIIGIDTDGGSGSPANESPQNAIDGTLDKYLNFGDVNSGFIVTPGVGATIVSGFQITTANDFEGRDPAAWELYGTNDVITSTDNSTGNTENWTLIDSGAVALPATRNTPGPVVTVDNSASYTSYRMVFMGLKDAETTMQFAEIQFFGETSLSPLLSPGSEIVAIDLDGESSYPDEESPQNAVDGTLAKYLNFGETNSGFIVTPSSNPVVVQSFRITTANDAADRDPTAWQLFGTNDVIVSGDNSTGNAENWTLIDSGAVSLPLARNTDGPVVAVDNDTAYSSYRMVFTGVRNAGAANSMQVAEIEFYGDSGISPSPASLRLESPTGDVLLEIAGSELVGNTINYFPSLDGHVDVRVVVQAGSAGLGLEQTDLTISDEHGNTHTIYLPAIALAAGERLDLWVANSGATYYGEETQTEPNFSFIVRLADLSVPFLATQPGFVVEEVSSDYRLPVNIAFVPNPGPDPDDPLYYVTEHYGSIQVVTRDGTKHEFASGLLDYNPQGPISGSGEQGLTGIAVVRDELNPEIYHLFVGMLWDNGAPAGSATHYPKVERIDSIAGGLTMGTRTVLLNMQPETQGQSHQISNVSIGPDGKLYVHNGDGFDASTAQNLNLYRGKILRMNLDGSAPADNPFYNAGDGISARDYVFAYGFRNPFGGAWRSADGKHYSVENGPSVDRMAQINAGANYGWNGSNASMLTNAIYNWNPSHAPVNITFIQESTLGGSAFPAALKDVAFVSESGPTYAEGPQAQGKRIVGFKLDAAGNVIGGPTTLVEYVGTGHASVVGLAAGPDGLYFSELYEDSGANGPTASGARIFRVRYVGGQPGDFDLDGDVDGGDLQRWQGGYGTSTNATVSVGDSDADGDVDGRDFLTWQRNFTGGAGISASLGIGELVENGYSAEAGTDMADHITDATQLAGVAQRLYYPDSGQLSGLAEKSGTYSTSSLAGDNPLLADMRPHSLLPGRIEIPQRAARDFSSENVAGRYEGIYDQVFERVGAANLDDLIQDIRHELSSHLSDT